MGLAIWARRRAGERSPTPRSAGRRSDASRESGGRRGGSGERAGREEAGGGRAGSHAGPRCHPPARPPPRSGRLLSLRRAAAARHPVAWRGDLAEPAGWRKRGQAGRPPGRASRRRRGDETRGGAAEGGAGTDAGWAARGAGPRRRPSRVHAPGGARRWGCARRGAPRAGPPPAGGWAPAPRNRARCCCPRARREPGVRPAPCAHVCRLGARPQS